MPLQITRMVSARPSTGKAAGLRASEVTGAYAGSGQRSEG